MIGSFCWRVDHFILMTSKWVYKSIPKWDAFKCIWIEKSRASVQLVNILSSKSLWKILLFNMYLGLIVRGMLLEPVATKETPNLFFFFVCCCYILFLLIFWLYIHCNPHFLTRISVPLYYLCLLPFLLCIAHILNMITAFLYFNNCYSAQLHVAKFSLKGLLYCLRQWSQTFSWSDKKVF